MLESNLRKCKKCLQMKQRIQIGKYDHINKKFADENNKLWSGSTCPSCHLEKIKNNMKKLRESRKGGSNEATSD